MIAGEMECVRKMREGRVQGPDMPPQGVSLKAEKALRHSFFHILLK